MFIMVLSLSGPFTEGRLLKNSQARCGVRPSVPLGFLLSSLCCFGNLVQGNDDASIQTALSSPTSPRAAGGQEYLVSSS